VADLHDDRRERTANEFFDRTAGENPAWWQPFMRYACDRSSDPAGLGRMVTVRSRPPSLRTTSDAASVARLQRDGGGRMPISSGGQRRRRESGPRGVYNGGFELPMSNLGFDWILPVRDGVTVGAQPVEGAIASRPAGRVRRQAP